MTHGLIIYIEYGLPILFKKSIIQGNPMVVYLMGIGHHRESMDGRYPLKEEIGGNIIYRLPGVFSKKVELCQAP